LPLGVSLLYSVLLFALLDKSRFIREVSVEDLQEEDILAEPVKGFNKKVIEKHDKEVLRKLGVKEVKILENLPKMGPGLFLSLLVLLFPLESVKFLSIDPVLILFHGF
jgi:hypothetical protein